MEKHRDYVSPEECHRPAAGSASNFHGQAGCWSEDGVLWPHAQLPWSSAATPSTPANNDVSFLLQVKSDARGNWGYLALRRKQ